MKKAEVAPLAASAYNCFTSGRCGKVHDQVMAFQQSASGQSTRVPRAPKIQWGISIPFFLMHLAALSVFFVPFAWKWVGLCALLYFVRMFGVTAGYHRYFSHRTYKLNRFNQFLMAWLATSSIQKGVLWWGANHRHHHRFSDTEQDIHSPVRTGFWWSHVGWILSDAHTETDSGQIQDLVKFSELRWINRYHLVPGIILGVSVFLLGGWSALCWGFFLSTALLWHGTFTINSLSHVFGKRRYETSDTSRNNGLLAFITLGEGWHNNHHAYMSATRQGFFWWEFDFTYYGLKMLSWIGVVRAMREPPLELLERRRIRKPLKLRLLRGGLDTRASQLRSTPRAQL
jgi:stearoyl-CoA desaturase (delta-9 desaturase)